VSKRDLGPILGRNIRLRLLEPDDLERTLEWRNRAENRRWFVHSEPLSLDSHLGWFRRYQERDDDYVFVVESLDETPRQIGQVSLYHIDWDSATAEFGRLLIGDPAARGRGYGLDATRTLLGFGFDTMRLKLIRLEVFAENTAAIRIYRRCGFQPLTPSTAGNLLSMELSDRVWVSRQSTAQLRSANDFQATP